MRAILTTGSALALLAAVGCSSSSQTTTPGVDAGHKRDAADGAVTPKHDASDGAVARHSDAGHDARVEASASHDAAHPEDAGHHDAASHHDAAHPEDSAHHDARSPADARDAATAKDAADASSASAFAPLAACLGPSMALTLSGQMPYVDVPVGSESGYFVLDFATTFSSIDLTAFAPPGPTTTGCDTDAGVLYQECTVAGFAFFSPPSSVYLETESFSWLTGAVRQAGIIGTDFLSEDVFSLDYGALEVYAAPQSTVCTAAALGAAGFVPLTTAGFYVNDLSLLEPLTDVETGAPSNYTVPNVPTVPVAIAGVDAVAQLDTGFDDSVTPFSVNINQAFYNAVVAANPNALVRDTSLDTTLTTCISGVSEPVQGYRLASGVGFGFVQTSGAVARSYPQAAIFEKLTPAAAATCGGIGPWTVPAAQVAASFYNDMKTLVFDPFGSLVWMPTK
jgi:hypothetical protein